MSSKPEINWLAVKGWACAFLICIGFWAFIILGFCMSSCTPISKAESQRINQNYNDFYNRTRGMKVRR